MTHWARILPNTKAVAEVIDYDPAEHFHSDIVWIATETIPAIGSIWNGKSFDVPPPPPVKVPDQVGAVQALAYLHSIPGRTEGKTMFEDFDAAVSASDDKILQLAWARASVFSRTGPLMDAAAKLVSPPLTDEELDGMFIAADKIKT